MLRVCVNTLNNDESSCTTGYNSEDKQPEYVFINLFSEEYRNLPNGDIDSQGEPRFGFGTAQSQSKNNELTTTIINCPPESRCVIEQSRNYF
jgi:hypothetical protein